MEWADLPTFPKSYRRVSDKAQSFPIPVIHEQDFVYTFLYVSIESGTVLLIALTYRVFAGP